MDNMRKLADTITKDGDVALERGRELTDSAWEKGRETWKDMSQQGREAMMQAQKSAEEAWGDTQQLVQKHPGKSVGIALVVGVAIGALLTFRKND